MYIRNNDKYIPQLIIIGSIIAIGAAGRSMALEHGADSFTAYITFIVSILLALALYLMVSSMIQELCNKFLKKKNLIAQATKTQKEEEQTLFDSNFDYRGHLQKALETKLNEQQEKVNAAVCYTEQTFAPYITEAELAKLRTQVQLFLTSNCKEEELRSVKISQELKSIDLMHFGWNIAQPFKKQRKEISIFLKQVFAHALEDVELSTIQRKLSNREGKCIIPLNKEE